MNIQHVGGVDEWRAACGNCDWVSNIGPEVVVDEVAAAHVCGAKPGDEFAEAWLKAGEALLAKKNAGTATPAELAVLADAQLHARDIAAKPEVADDPKTLLTDESQRPQLDGTDYLDEQKKRDCDEWVERIEAEAVKLGEVAIRGAIAALTARLGA